MKTLFYGLANLSLFAAGAVALLSGAVNLFNGAAASIAVTKLAVGLILVLSATIDRFELLEGLGMKAKTRTLDKKIEEADLLVRKLRNLTELSAREMLNIHCRFIRQGRSPTLSQTMRLVEELRETMIQTGLTEEAVRSAVSPWIWGMCYELTSGFWARLTPILNARVDELRNSNEPTQELEDYRSSRSHPVTWHALPVEDFPQILRNMFADIPAIRPHQIASLRQEAERFANEMSEFIRTGKLLNSVEWTSKLDQFRGP